MRLFLATLVMLAVVGSAFRAPLSTRKFNLFMSTTAEGDKKLAKVEAIKVRSNYLNDPLKEVFIYLFVYLFIYFMLFHIFLLIESSFYLGVVE